MKLKFSKYQGTGNDFIMIDNLNGDFSELSIETIVRLCDRKFGIGADGLIKINRTELVDFEVDYFNADGSKSFCGNGARCAVSFANRLGINVENTHFLAIDGHHTAEKKGDLVHLKMNEVNEVLLLEKDYELNTGSPHFIRFVENAWNVNVVHEGRKVRYAPNYQENGINVNFVEELSENLLEVATYERGVEDETLSCGTGVTAAALAYLMKHSKTGKQEVQIHTKGGHLSVTTDSKGNGQFSDIYLVGPAVEVFNGEIEI
jgi:diaminopimelate epimerase